MDTPLPHATCPVCGQPNDCAPAACGRFDTDCWCTRAAVHPEALARVPRDRIGIACLCRRCLTGLPPAPGRAAG
jgi:hypothetical protein